MAILSQFTLIKDGEITLPLDSSLTSQEEKIIAEKNITVKYTDNKGKLYKKRGEEYIPIHPLLNNEKKENTLDFSHIPHVKNYTALNAHENIFKGDINIKFRAELDDCIAHTLFLESLTEDKKVISWLMSIRSILGNVMAATCMDMALQIFEIDGLDAEKIHQFSHNPLKHLEHDHIVPTFEHGKECIRINTLRTKIRLAEVSAYKIYADEHNIQRPDILYTLNRLSSACYVLMIMAIVEKMKK